MKRILQLFSLVLFVCLAIVLFGVTSRQTAYAIDPLTGSCHWATSNHIYCGENTKAVDYYFNSAATKSYGQDKYAVFLDGNDSNPVLFLDMTGDGQSAFLTDKVETIPRGAQNGLTDKDRYNNVPADGTCSIHRPTNCDEHLDGPFSGDSRFNAKWGDELPFPADVQKNFVDGTLATAAQSGDCIDNPLSFFLCPLAEMITKTVDGLTSFLVNTLTLTPLSKQGTAIQDGFSAFKNIANSVYVIIFLIIIFSNFFSTGLDSYSVKKMLPRLIAAVIVTQFGFLICALMVDFSNVLIVALPAALSPGKTLGESISSNMFSLIGTDGLTGFLTGISYFIIVLILAIALLVIILIALAYIVFRNVFLIVLVFLFPLAAAAWVLPQTQQYAKKWATWFIKLLLMGPIVALILASTVIIQSIFQAAGQGGDKFLEFISVFVPFVGIAIIPKSFKWSGDVMTAAGKAVQGSAVGKVATGVVKKSAEEGGIAKAKGTALSALSAGSTSSFGRSMQAKGAAYGAKSAKAKADMYDSLSVKDLTRLGNNGDTGAQKALRNKYRAKAVEAKQAFDAGFTMSPTEQAGFDELASAAGGQGYAASTQQWQTEKEAKVAGSNITTLQSTVALGTPSATNPTPTPQQQADAAQAQVDINNLYNTEVQYHQQNYEATGAAPSKTERENFNRLAHAAAGNTDPYNPSQHSDYYGQAQSGWTPPAPPPAGGACWVAREVYGIHNPRWIEFREWMLLESPSWFRNTYIKHGEQFALWLKPHSYTKKAIKIFMDSRIKASQNSK